MARNPPPTSPDATALPQVSAGLPAGRQSLRIGDDLDGLRLDRALAALLPGVSRSRLKALIEAGKVRDPGGKTIVEPSSKVKSGRTYEIDVPEPEPAEPRAQAMALDILFEDDDIVVLDKPAGLVVHPAPGNPDRTLVNALLAHCGESLSGIGGVRRPGIVHRLDKDTSGVMVAAKNDIAHAGLARQFAAHSIERVYLAITAGCPLPRQGRIEGNIGRHPRDRKRMSVLAGGGKPATTAYRVVEVFGDPLEPLAALVECRLLTGRTHQVRVHLAHRGHPLVGDPLYFRSREGGSRKRLGEIAAVLGRQALHARVLGFVHPRTGQPVRFESDFPQDFNTLLDTLRGIHRGSNIRER